MLSHLYVLWNWNKQIQTANNVPLGKLKLLQKENRALSEKLAEVTTELADVEQQKKMDRASFLEKTKAIAELR
jgi:hypothetical protein